MTSIPKLPLSTKEIIVWSDNKYILTIDQAVQGAVEGGRGGMNTILLASGSLKRVAYQYRPDYFAVNGFHIGRLGVSSAAGADSSIFVWLIIAKPYQRNNRIK